jgi:predicted acyltransferase
MMITMQGKPSAIATAPNRVLSIDVLRGITIALMILVNDPGDWSHVYSQLDHAEWSGFTLTDLVFPNFLFLVGASIILSLQSRIRRGESRRSLALHILRRSAIILALDLFFNDFPHFHTSHLRVYGVLTRIALCYLCVGLICLFTQRASRLFAIAAALLIGYWAVMRFVPVPGFGVPTHDIPLLDPDRNLAAWLDRGITAFLQRTLHTGRLYQHTRDPEGLLSTLPAIATTLLGSIAALWLRRVVLPPAHIASNVCHSERSEEPPHFARRAAEINPAQCVKGLILSGILSLAAGLLWNPWFPINKNLWTSSYVLFAAGLTLLLLAVSYWLLDIRHINDTRAGKWLTFPWLVFGSNAIVAFCFSDFIVEVMLWIKVQDAGKTITAWHWVYLHVFSHGNSTKVTSVAFALTFVAVCFLPNLLLWRKRIFLKI